MLKRVVVLGDDKKLLKAAEKAAAGVENVLVTPFREGLHATVALATPAHAEAAIAALAETGREHEALFALLAEAVDAREGHQTGSCARLCDHALRLGKALDLDAGELDALERGALLHDIGKLRVSNEVLMKKSVLSYDEWIELQAHTTKGAELLRALGFDPEIRGIVQYHHECYDGDGYPDHLEGEKIPLLARVMKICDVFTAMTSPRHYRPGIPTIDDGLAHLREERGKHFDPDVIDVFLENNIGQPWTAA